MSSKRTAGRGSVKAATIALAAIMIAVTAVFTLMIRVPIPATQGYFNFSSVAITFAGLAFGPWVGLAAGGLGTALADLVGGYGQWAPISLIAHGSAGLIIGFVGRKRMLPAILLGCLLGTLSMVASYYVGAAAILVGDWNVPLVEVPINVFQGAVGAVVGIPLYYAVRRAFPPLDQVAKGATWAEEEPPR